MSLGRMTKIAGYGDAPPPFLHREWSPHISPHEEVTMTSTTTSTTSAQPGTDRSLIPIGVATAVGSSALAALGVYGDGTPGAEPDTGEFLFIVGISVVAAAVVFGLVVPRVRRSARAAGTGLGLAIAALVLVLAFWTGLTPPLAVGGILLGAAARQQGRRPGLGGAAMAIGVLALLGYVAIYVTDWMATNNIAGM